MPEVAMDEDVTPERQAQAEAQALATAIRLWTIGALAGILAVLLVFEVLQLRNGDWAGAVVLSVALFGGGYLVGLLFAVPRTTGADPAAPLAQGNDTLPEGQRTAALQRRILLVNTSFEQISDWLTKIIVGVGLVQFQPILAFMERNTKSLATDLTGANFDAAHAEPLAAGILIAFPVLGVLMGFFSVRLYIAWAIYVADAEATRPVEQYAFTFALRKQAEIAVPVSDMSRAEQATVPREEAAHVLQFDAAAIDKILRVPLEKLTKVEDIVAWGRASLARRSYNAARDAFTRAIGMAGDDPKTVLDYVEALYEIEPRDYQAMVGSLQRALLKLDSTVSRPIRQRINEELLNAYLYTPAPSGFENAIKLGDTYLAGDGSDQYATYVYLAAAHGQRYTYYKKLGDARAPSELKILTEILRKAIQLGGDAARRWCANMTKDGVDNDLLAAVTDSEEIRDLLKPPAA
jgi:hypothetical protein